MSFFHQRLRGALVGAILVLTACAQHGGALPFANGAAARPNAVPPNCKGQHDYSDYATVSKSLKTKGGKFCIPAFGGYGGTLDYPTVSNSIKLTLTSSTSNYDGMPELGSGSAMFYMQFSTSGGTSFGTKGKAGGGLTGAGITAGDPYTIYGQVVIYSYKVKLGPCYTTATKGKYGGVIGGFSSLIKGRDIPFKASGVLEIYSGEETGTGC